MDNPERLFQALADETRLKMLALIRRHGELCVCDLTNVLEITQSKASRHLRYLLNAGLVQDRREAVWSHYRLTDSLDSAQQAILEAIPNLLDPGTISQLDLKLSVWLARKGPGAVRNKNFQPLEDLSKQ